MAPQHRIVVTTRNPVSPGLVVKVVRFDDESDVLVEGVLDSGGAFRAEVDADKDTIVFLLLIDDEGEERIRCRVPLHALNPMECFMTNPEKLSVDEAHKRFMAAHRRLKLAGVENPDPDAVARMAFT